MTHQPKITLTKSQKNAIKSNLAAGRTARELFETGRFNNMSLRSFYRYYREMAILLGYKKGYAIKWETEETDKAWEIAKNGGTSRDVAEAFPGRTPMAVRRKLAHEGIEPAKISLRTWTDDELEALKNAAASMTAREIYESGMFPNKTLSSIKHNLVKIKDKTLANRPWSKEEEGIIEDCLLSGNPLSKLVGHPELEGRSLSSINTKGGYIRRLLRQAGLLPKPKKKGGSNGTEKNH